MTFEITGLIDWSTHDSPCCRCDSSVWLPWFPRSCWRLVSAQGRSVRLVRRVHHQRPHDHLHAEGRLVCRPCSQRQFVCTDTTLICCFTPPEVVIKKVFHLHEVDDDVTQNRKRAKSRRRKKFRGHRSRRRDLGAVLGLKHQQLTAYTDSSYQQQPNKH